MVVGVRGQDSPGVILESEAQAVELLSVPLEYMKRALLRPRLDTRGTPSPVLVKA